MGLEDDDILVELRHKELISEIKALRTELAKQPKDRDDNGVKDSMEKLLKALTNMPKPDAPVVNISNNNDELSEILKKHLSAQIPESKEEISEERKEIAWIHKITKRDRNGFVDEIESKLK